MFDSNISMIVSNRQRGKEITGVLEKQGVVLRFANLKTGDFLLSGKMAVEIDTADEFLESIANKMLFRKLIDFKRDFPEAVFIIQGFNNANGKMSSSKVRTAISYITILNRMPVIMTSDAKDSAEYLNLLARQVQHGLTFDPEVERQREKFATTRDAQVAIAEALPEVGPTTAEALLLHFGSLKKLFSAPVEELVEVGGVGLKKAQKIRAFIEARFHK